MNLYTFKNPAVYVAYHAYYVSNAKFQNVSDLVIYINYLNVREYLYTESTNIL